MSWQEERYIQPLGGNHAAPLGCMSWQKERYIQLGVHQSQLLAGCMSWQKGRYDVIELFKLYQQLTK